MRTRTNLRALSPGKWARVIVPDCDCAEQHAIWDGKGKFLYHRVSHDDDV